MNTLRELTQKGQELASRIAKFGAPMGNKNAAGPHNMGEKIRHEEQQKYHAGEATVRGENQARPPKGSHAEAASHHGSAVFYHGKAAEALAAGKVDEANAYNKQAYRAGGIADSKSKNIASGKIPYPTAKENTPAASTLTPQERMAKRADTFLRQRFIGPIRK